MPTLISRNHGRGGGAEAVAKKIGFLTLGSNGTSMGRGRAAPRTLLQTIELAQAAEDLGAINGAAVARTHPGRGGIGGGLAIHPQSPSLAEQIQVFRDVWNEAVTSDARMSVSRSIFALTDKQDRMYFVARNQDEDQVRFIDSGHQAISGRSYAAEPPS